ncbi:MAG: hypothetical protein ABF391_01775, partial [Akkermansiaceae bacterium]
AVGGSKRARRGLCKALNLPQDCWEGRGLERYRLYLYDEGVAVEPQSPSLGKRKRGRRGFKMEARSEAIERKGKISPAQALRKRIASFSTGVAIGSERFVKRMASRYQDEMGRKKLPKSHQDPGAGGFYVMRE